LSELYIGLSSGTSMDAIDAVLAELDDGQCRLQSTRSHGMSGATLDGLRRLVEHPDEAGLATFGELDVALGREFAQAALALLADAGADAAAVRAIGSHGQTVLHAPRGQRPFSLQIGDPNVIAADTGITTVADFRRRDIALGGEGAPLVAAFHKAVFGSPDEYRAVLNIGGIANLTLLAPDGTVSGCDTGPGNTLMDNWTRRHQGRPYDEDGSWAASASWDEGLLEELLEHEYFARPAPKSTGVEDFNLLWVQGILDRLPQPVRPEAVQATLCELTARTVADLLTSHGPGAGRLFLCGGGARNEALVRSLGAHLPEWRIEPTDALGIAADWVEAAAFAWLAGRTLAGLPGNVPAVTGASRETVLGGIYRP
jgi:anhydro-N-acetylmuramic acid kinase